MCLSEKIYWGGLVWLVIPFFMMWVTGNVWFILLLFLTVAHLPIAFYVADNELMTKITR